MRTGGAMVQPLVPNDLYHLTLLTDPQRDPERRRTFVRRTSFDRDANAVRGAIWCLDDDGALRAFTAGTNDRLARPSRDGATLAFVSDVDGGVQVKLLPLDGGEARSLGTPFTRVRALAWSRNGRTLAVAASAAHDPATAKIAVDPQTNARHIRALPFKSDDDGLLDGTRTHLFVFALDGEPAPRQITRGDFDVMSPDFNDDGTSVAFAAAIDVPEDRFIADIHVVDLATGARRALTHGEGAMMMPRFAPDGRSIAFVGHTHGDDAGGRFNTEVLTIDADGGPIASLSASLDRSIGDRITGDIRDGMGDAPLQWSDDGREIYAQTIDEGTCGVRAFALDGTSRVIAGGERDVYAFSLDRDGRVTIAYATPERPSECAVIEDGRERRITALNETLLRERTIVSPRRIRPVAADGTRLDAWILEPAGVTKPPLIVQIHGGPHMAYGYAFCHEFQILVSHGFAVAYGNPRGGQSYGHAYADAITGDWGGIDMSDVLAIIDAVEATIDIDRGRIGVAGGSYGGFMTTWLLGHCDRFAAGVSMRAVNDFVSEIGASDIGWFLEREMQRAYRDDDGRALFERSPMRAATAISAPLLIDHSERDYRCPVDQGEQLFTLLRRLGKTAEFVRFTGDGHELSRRGSPRNRVLRLRAIAHWFIRHLHPAGIEAIADSAGALFEPLPSER